MRIPDPWFMFCMHRLLTNSWIVPRWPFSPQLGLCLSGLESPCRPILL